MNNYAVSSRKLQLILGNLNIQGSFSKKITYPECREFINRTDICAIQESWLRHKETFSIPNFKHFKANRKESKKAKRGSGGIILLYNDKLHKGISRQKSSDEKHTIWIKCDKDYFGLKEDLYAVAAYFPPQNSQSSTNNANCDTIFDKLEKDLNLYTNKGDVILLGDFNARVGTKSEIKIDNSSLFDCSDNTHNDLLPPLPQRNAQDIKTNTYGTKLLNLCSTSNLVILNGRKLGDLGGKLTSHQYNGSSTVDLSLCTRDIYYNITHFRVLDPVWFSDHCPTLTYLNTGILNDYYVKNDTTPLLDLPTKFKWHSHSSQKFSDVLSKSSTLFEELIRGLDINHDVETFEKILIAIADKTLEKQNVAARPKSNTKSPWMTKDTFIQQTLVKKLKASFLKENTNLNRRSLYLNEKKKLKTMLYQVKKAFTDKKLNKIGKLIHASPRLFWSAIKRAYMDTKQNKSKCVPPRVWRQYFEKLLATPKPKMGTKLGPLINNEVDNPLTIEEVSYQLKNLKPHKSSSSPLTNDMLRVNPNIIAPSLTKLFNRILCSRTYPKSWCTSNITPLFKSGDPSNPEDYRGLSVGNALASLFAKCINKRIQDFLEEQSLLPKNSLGFRKGYRTEDGMFLLNTITQKYTTLNKNIHTVFIDFSKFYDSINHDLLFNKMYSIGLKGNILAVIMSMYSNINYRIRIETSNKTALLAHTIKATIGLKQGCPLSPTLANIFLYDIHTRLQLNDVSLGDINLNSISWADDLVLFSTKRTSTQKLLDSLAIYCADMQIKVKQKH